MPMFETSDGIRLFYEECGQGKTGDIATFIDTAAAPKRKVAQCAAAGPCRTA